MKRVPERKFWFFCRVCSFFFRRMYSIFISSCLGAGHGRFEYGAKIIGSSKISFGNNFFSCKGLWIESVGGNVFISDNVSVSNNFHLASYKNVFIGNNVLIGSDVMISDHDHGYFGTSSNDWLLPPNERKLYSKGEVIINDNVWIADNVKVLSGVSIGKGAVIGANSVVTKNIPDYSLAMGSPAKVIRVYKTKD